MKETMRVRRLDGTDVDAMRVLLACYARAFNEIAVYTISPPSNSYLQKFLAQDSVIVLVAEKKSVVVGGLTAYKLLKPEQERSEVYLYDLAVDERHRRQGIAQSLVQELRRLSKTLGAYEVFVQADYEDRPAIELYSQLGEREEVLHFAMPVK